MNNIKSKDIFTTLKQYSEIKLLINLRGKEEVVELDKVAKSMIIGYLNKKEYLNKKGL